LAADGASLRDEAAEREFGRVQALVTAIREVRAQHNVPPKRRVILHLPKSLESSLHAALPLVQTLAGVGTVTANPPTAAAVAFTFEGAECKLSDLADAVDAGAERARLEKLIADLDKTIKTLEGRLANPGYAEKAPPHMVQQTKDQLAKATSDREAAAAAFRKLG
jgi:valyl-tRNA synthetase